MVPDHYLCHPIKYRVSQFVRLWLQTKTFDIFVTESNDKKIIAVGFNQYDDLATLKVQYIPRFRLGEYCTLWTG